MLALVGLLGLAFAGTALVGFSQPEDSDASDEARPEEDAYDLIDIVEFEDPAQGFSEDIIEDDVPISTNAILSGLATTSAPVTDGGDVLAGGDADDMIDGQGGDDYINGSNGDDTLLGGDGIDQMHGGAGDDYMTGDDGDDLVYGYVGDDEMTGGAGDDKLHGGAGSDLIEGGYDDDELLGGYGDDTLIGGAGRDQIQGSEGDDVIDGVTGEDVAEQDYLNGSEGNDLLIGNNGDVMSGGDGSDTFEMVNGTVSIMDYAVDDTLVLRYDGDIPTLTTEIDATGLTLLANGAPVASLFGVTEFDVSSVQLVAA